MFRENGCHVGMVMLYCKHRDRALAGHIAYRRIRKDIPMQIVSNEHRRYVQHFEEMPDRFLETGKRRRIRQFA